MSVFPPTSDVSNVATYMASTAFFTPATNTTDFLEILGSGSKTVEILKIIANSWFGSNTDIFDVRILKRSTASSGGTSVTTTAVPLDSNDAAATAVIKHFTANPTVGTLVGQIAAVPAKTIYELGHADFDRGQVLYEVGLGEKPITLRGAAQSVVLNGNGVTVPNTWSFTVVFRERA